MAFQGPDRRREIVVLALGLASAGVLAGAAFAPLGDPDLAARTQLADLAGRAAEGIAAEWALACRLPTPPAPAASQTIGWATLHASPPLVRAATTDEHGQRSPSFEVFFAEAERAEIADGDPRAALALVDTALAKSPSGEQRARGLVRAVQLAARIDDEAVVRTRFAAAQVLDPSVDIDDTSARVVVLLAASARLEPDELSRECNAISQYVIAEIAPLPGSPPRYELTGGRFERTLDPRRAAFEARLAAVCGPRVLWNGFDSAMRRSALRATLGELPSSGSETWTLIPLLGEVFGFHDAGQGALEGAFFTRTALEGRVEALARERGLLDGGFELDFSGDRSALGPVVRPRVELSSGVLGFTLRHPDPASIGRAAGRRARWLRGGLLLLAALSAFAATATFRALRRERRLAQMRSRFVANVSHELRTPLASILLMAENLEAGRVPEGQAQRYHSAVRNEALRLRRLVDDVLDFSRLERGKKFDVRPESTDVATWARDLETDLRDMAQRNALELAFEMHALPASADIDREALRRAVQNLVDNARKHSGSKRVDVRVAGRGDELVIGVRDHGRGIPAAKRAAVFEPFTRLDEESGAAGAGLGLAIVREIAEAHGGRVVALDPESGDGITIEIALPLAARVRGEP